MEKQFILVESGSICPHTKYANYVSGHQKILATRFPNAMKVHR